MKIIFPILSLSLLFQFSNAQSWVRQNPFPFLSQMYDIDFDGPYGLAVGKDATIYTTTNGGKTWIQNKATDSTRTLTTVLVVPGTSGQLMLAGGDNNLILTENGGKFWKTTHNYIPTTYKIQSLGGNTLIALGGNFGLKTTDKGKLWFAFNMPGMGVTAGHFTSLKNGWVAYGAPFNQQVWVTTNGGNTWSVRDPLKHSLITSIEMLNDQVGFMASTEYIYKTTDGGYHWIPLHDVAAEGGINDLHVVDEYRIWSSMNNGSIFYSTEGVWHEAPTKIIQSNKTLGIWANVDGEVWTVGKYNSILHSTNYGKTWADQIPAAKETLFEPSFFNEFVGMVGGSDGTIMRTTNSGAKWEKIIIPGNDNFFGLEMVDDNVVIAASTSGKVLLSEDMGSNWITIGQNMGIITDLKAFNRYEIILTTDRGKIFKTSDGGSQWAQVYSNSSDHLYGLDFFNHQFGWATGWNGSILATTDGGETWSKIYSDSRTKFSDIHFTSPTEGWVVSSSATDTIWHTFNSGSSWQKSVLPVKTNWNAISFMDSTTGWITGGSDGFGIVLRTDNGGNSWYTTHESPDALMGIYAVPGQETVWAVGFGGNIMKYASCSVPPAITGLSGVETSCKGDTVTYVASFNGVDKFDWSFPSDWILLGNSNSSSIQLITGSASGQVTVQGSDACSDTTLHWIKSVVPMITPVVTISNVNGTLIPDINSGNFQWLMNGEPISGATNASFRPIMSGHYQLQYITSASGCETFSNELTITVSPLQNAEWVRQNPFPFLSQLYDIDFDGPYGLAVGADATIYTTTDGGKTWAPNKATDSTRTLTTAYVVPGTHGQLMLAGGNDNLIITENGGKLWKTTHNYIPGLYKIESLPNGELIALGANFGLRSTDTGLIWFPFNMPGMGVTAGDFTSEDHGWVSYGAFNNQQVYITTNGGNSWEIRDSLKHSLITSIEMLNDEVGFMSSLDFVYKTTDGGYHWIPLHTIASDGGINDLHIVDENNIWASLNNGSVYYSTVGGGLWHEINPNLINSNKTLGIWANIEGEVWMVGKYVSVLYSPDFGVTWTDQIPAAKETLFEPNFYNEFVGIVGGSDGTIMRTKNSGAKWEKIEFPLSENFYGAKMIDDKIALAGSSSGKVFFTEDLGDNWTVIGQNLGQITDLHAFNRFEIMVTNESGKIYKTSDAGGEWKVVYNNSNDNLTGIYFFDHQTGWVTGLDGRILKTTDGGESWNTQVHDDYNQFSDVHFTTSSEGWVVSSSLTDTIWHTFDGGQTWQASVLPVRTFWRAISFMNHDIGWITGGSDGYGIVLRTDNGGASWYLSHESPDALMGIYAVPGQETVWAVGFGGNIMKYSNCSAPPTVSELRGNLEPCVGDTVNFVVEFNGVDLFDWTYPADWILLGNANSSSIYMIAGPTSGQITIQGSDACGDTTIHLATTVTPVVPPDVVITFDNGDLVSNVSSGFFQWFLDGNIIPGATDFIYHPLVNGTYQLHMTTFTSGCETVSNALEVTLTATDLIMTDQLLVYPNPASDLLYIRYRDGKGVQAGSPVSLISIDGKNTLNTKLETDHINLTGLPPGIYTIRIQSKEGFYTTRVVIE